MSASKEQIRLRRKLSIRHRVSGTEERPRLTVFRSSKHIYAQVISADGGKVLASASTLDKELRDAATGNIDAAKKVGLLVAERAKVAGITQHKFELRIGLPCDFDHLRRIIQADDGCAALRQLRGQMSRAAAEV